MKKKPMAQHKQPLFEYTEPLCGLIYLQTSLENNFQSPIFIKCPRSPLPYQHKQLVCGQTQPLCSLLHLKLLLENNFQGSHVYQSPPLPSQHNKLVCEHTDPLFGLTDLKNLLENNFQIPMFIKCPPPINITHHCVNTRNHCEC